MLTSVVLKMLRICSEEGGRGLDKCSKLAQKREGGVKKRPENAHMINERSLIDFVSTFIFKIYKVYLFYIISLVYNMVRVVWYVCAG